MDTPPNMPALDPYNLIELMQDINRRTSDTMLKDFSSVVNEAALEKLKDKLREDISPLLVEVLHDWQEVQLRLGTQEIFGEHRHIPTLNELAEQLPTVFRQLPPPDGSVQYQDALKQRCLDQVKWVVDIWLQVTGYLTRHLAEDAPVAVEYTVEANGQPTRVPNPMEIDAISHTWQLLRRLTVEYLQKKGELLRAHGEDVPIITANLGLSEGDPLTYALEAFWGNRVYSSTLLIQALRQALVTRLQLFGADVRFDLRVYLTSTILDLAYASGLSLPFEREVTCRLATELELDFYYTPTIRITPLALLYPAVRILSKTIEKINSLPPQPAVRQRIIQMMNPRKGGR